MRWLAYRHEVFLQGVSVEAETAEEAKLKIELDEDVTIEEDDFEYSETIDVSHPAPYPGDPVCESR